MPSNGVDNFWSNWSNIEWLIAAIWAAGSVVAGFVWRLQLRVAMLEHSFEEREASTERRHQENMHVARGLQQQLVNLGERIDRLVDRGSMRDS